VLKNRHQAVSQSTIRSKLNAQSSEEKPHPLTFSFQLRAFSSLCEHSQKPHRAGSMPQAQFFNAWLIIVTWL
jgi:hypothetical protein